MLKTLDDLINKINQNRRSPLERNSPQEITKYITKILSISNNGSGGGGFGIKQIIIIAASIITLIVGILAIRDRLTGFFPGS